VKCFFQDFDKLQSGISIKLDRLTLLSRDISCIPAEAINLNKASAISFKDCILCVNFVMNRVTLHLASLKSSN